jgi:hypothetical protein
MRQYESDKVVTKSTDLKTVMNPSPVDYSEVKVEECLYVD